ncbi:hypothetical protein GCM10011609_19470 [Lentzea pudingi]|uniref:DUF3558 domain-containing protein n=2 Tax=Lentzea pudingi TaxID=1789439 RepID=A0ABQ2HJF1_9PSEU|nr:hypothetical protein GCM10011609_19470 [Lentzea pudingi]
MRLLPVLLLALTACAACTTSAPKFVDADPCSLLRSGDVGELKGTPARSGQACDFTFDSLTAELTLREAAFADESQKLLADGGYGGAIAGGEGESNNRPLTTRCTDSSGVVTCDAVLEVRDRQLVGIQVVQRSTDRNVVGQVMQTLAAKAFERLPK